MNMQRTMSTEEIEEGNRRRAALYTSGNTGDYITAILMDMDCGGFGLYENIAHAKAEAILRFMEARNDG